MPAKSSKKKSSRKKNKSNKFKNFLLISIVGLTFVALVTVLLLPPKHKITRHSTQIKKSTKSSSPYKTPKTFSPAKKKPYVYEEKIGQEFDAKVRQADLAILQTIVTWSKQGAKLEHKNIETRYFHGSPFHFQNISVYLPVKSSIFFKRLQKNLDDFVGNTRLISQNRNQWTIVIDGQKTHILNIEIEPFLPSPGEKIGYLAIIIDDLGESIHYAQSLARLDFPITFSVLPYNTRTKEVCSLAKRLQIELMLHLPMEPNGYPDRANPGPGALFVHLGPVQIKSTFIDDLQQVHGAVGINNHMGSRFTSDKESMGVLFDEIKKKGLFFVDSLTTSKSVAKILAREKNIPYLQRHVFLDNVQEEKAILFQLQKAENVALRKGTAIAIGHPYAQTLKALQEWEKIRNTSVRVVQVRDLLKIKISGF